MYIKRLQFENTEDAFNQLLSRGVIDEYALNINGTIGIFDLPGGDYLLVSNDDICFEPHQEAPYLNTIQEFVGGRPNGR